MLKFKAIKIEQSGIKMYLTSLKISEIKELMNKKQLIVDVYDPSNPAGKEGYQRGVDEKRINDLSDFCPKKLIFCPLYCPVR